MNPQENIARVDALIKEIEAHPMCFHLVEDQTCYCVYYPEGYFPNGARASFGMGKAVALLRLLDVIERHWNENGI